MVSLTKKDRPVFRNLDIKQILGYRLPWAGKVSILHRISGALLFLMLPFLLYLFDLSITSKLSYSIFAERLAHPLIKLIVLGLVWAYLHHFCAGIRYLLMDAHVGVERLKAKHSAIAVLIVSLSLTLLFACKLFNLF